MVEKEPGMANSNAETYESSYHTYRYVDKYNVTVIGGGETKAVARANFNAALLNKDVPEEEITYEVQDFGHPEANDEESSEG